jgi:DNA-binding NtrC family response regulator
MLFSYTYESGFSEKDELYLYLIESLSCLTLKCPPLRQRKGDIPLLVGLYINAQNVSLNTQVVGIVTEGMLMLQNFPWERNIAQLYRVIRELVVNTKTSYISAASVESVLNREKNPQTVSPDIGINLNRTLDEITHEIVLRVFEEEKTNQTKTAKRLGISRSTLWRMLQ